MFEIKDLTISLISSDNKIIKNLVKFVSLTIPDSSIVCLVGESGSGKSLTAYSILRLMPSQNLKITGGQIFFNGKNLMELSSDEMISLRGKEMFMIPQEPLSALNPVLNIESQLSELFFEHTKMTKKEVKDACFRLLQMVKIDNPEARLKSYPHQLSGGQRQRVLIAMAMALSPSLIIADEPTTAIDVSIQGEILDLFIELKAKTKTGFLLITHDFGIVKAVADYVYVMYGGTIVEEGTKEEIFSNPLHPYTKGLMDAVPSLISIPKTPLKTIPGYAQISNYSCPFVERCKYATIDCKNDLQYFFIKKEHGILCHRTQKNL